VLPPTATVAVSVVVDATDITAKPTVRFGSNRLLASAISSAMATTVVLTPKTRCWIGKTLGPCWKLWAALPDAKSVGIIGKPSPIMVTATELHLVV
jgi:hypothetical protein